MTHIQEGDQWDNENLAQMWLILNTPHYWEDKAYLSQSDIALLKELTLRLKNELRGLNDEQN